MTSSLARLCSLSLAAALAACATGSGDAPSGGGASGGAAGAGGGGGDGGLAIGCPGGGHTTLAGVVYDPAGKDPLYNARVYVPRKSPLPFDEGVSCDRCAAPVSGDPWAIGLTDGNGHFELTDVPAGNDVPLVIQIGKWRRQVRIPEVKRCQANVVDDPDLLRLPKNKLEGDIPHMAIATGGADPFECLLMRIGLDPAELTRPSDNGRVHVYVALDGVQVDPPAPSAQDLWNDLATLEQYDVVMLPCEGDPAADEKSPEARQAIVDYANAGGRVYTTHYGYEWIAHGAEPFPESGLWHPDHDAVTDPLHALIDTSFPKGADFAAWLQNIGATAALGEIDLAEPRHDLDGPANGSTAWITAPATDGTESVQELTFNTPLDAPEEARCGRVAYSNFHVSAAARIPGKLFPDSCIPAALTAQEKALEFMLFDLSSCIDQDDHQPEPPPH